MKKRLLRALPMASVLCAALIFLGPDAVLAQQSGAADSLKASSRERGRSSARSVESRRPRDASRATRPTRSTDRTSRSARTADGTDERSRTAPAARPNDDEARTRSSTQARSPRRARTEARSDGGRRPTERARTGRDRRSDRDDDRRGDPDYDRRGDRDYERRDGRSRRGDGDHVILNRHPQGSSWARPRVHIDIGWPWVHRHNRRWSPRYRYQQIVYADAGWGGHRRESRLDLRTFYRHRVRDASARQAVVDIEIDRIEIYENGFFVGEVQRIPDELARMRAVVDRRHGVRFDRDIFLLGDPYAGFEMISTRHYDGFVLDKYRRSHGVRVGALDLRRERVVPLRRSRFFDPRDFSGFVPINLLPEDAGWLVDYGYDSYSGHYWGDDDRYYYGFSDLDDYARFGGDRATYTETEPRGSTTGREARSNRLTPERQALEQSVDRTFETDDGAKIRLKRESSIERVE